ncbi:prenyltransferase/squalene oxidase repeat-containing protein, partial [Streptomyces sp. NPDC058548]
MRQLDSAVAATTMHCLLTQRDNGSWSARPAPRVADTAMACFALSRSDDGEARGAVARARAWLFAQTDSPTATPLARLIERALTSLAVDDGAPIDLGSVHPETPQEARLVDLVHVMALYGDRPIQCGRSLQDLRQALRMSYTEGGGDAGAPGGSSRAADLAAAVLLDMPLHEDEPAWKGVARLVADQSPDGSCTGDVMATSLALLALDAAAHDTEAWARCRAYLLDTQSADGTWRTRPVDVLETAITVRSFRGDPAFDEHALPAAVQFLRTTQNADGGWAAHSDDVSDTGATALVLRSLAGLSLPDRTLRFGFAYLEKRQTAEGLWTPSASRLAAPCEETVAHVVAALRFHPHAHSVAHARAKAWIVEGVDGLAARQEGRFTGLPYAAHRTVDALGRDAAASKEAARTLELLQNTDGGWSPRTGEESTPAATGLALAVLEGAGLLDQQLWSTGLDHLLDRLDEEGRWDGGGELSDPGPLPLESPSITRAFAIRGLHAALRHAHAASPV